MVARMQRHFEANQKLKTLRKLGANMSSCGCVWDRHPKYGDVIIMACKTHAKKPRQA